MIIKANQKYIDMSCVKHLLATGEKNADFLTFQISKIYNNIDLSDCVFILRAVNSSQNLTEQTLKKQISDDSIFLTWTVNEYFTAVSGALKLEIRGVKSDELVIKYDLSDIFVRGSAVGEGLPQPDLIENAVSEMLGILAETKEISVKTPIIKNNTWWIFDSESLEYQDTGFSSRGDKGEQGEKGIKGDKGDKGESGRDGSDGKSVYQIWLDLGNSGTENDFITSLKGDKGEQGIQGEKGDTGEQGERGLQGLQGEKGEQGLQGIQGEKGDSGFSPTVQEYENTDTLYILQITNQNGSFLTPNLKGENGSGGSIAVDSALSDSSENPVQNKIISSNISSIWNEISNINDLIRNLSGSISVTPLYDYQNYSQYSPFWSFKNLQWDNSVYSFDEVSAKNSYFCSENNDFCMSFSNAFGWGADIYAVCSKPVKISSSSTLMIEYSCNSDGDGITVEILSSPDFDSEKIGEFQLVPAFYIVNTFISVNIAILSAPSGSGDCYLRFKLKTLNPAFNIRNISIVN